MLSLETMPTGLVMDIHSPVVSSGSAGEHNQWADAKHCCCQRVWAEWLLHPCCGWSPVLPMGYLLLNSRHGLFQRRVASQGIRSLLCLLTQVPSLPSPNSCPSCSSPHSFYKTADLHRELTLSIGAGELLMRLDLMASLFFSDIVSEGGHNNWMIRIQESKRCSSLSDSGHSWR